MTRDDFPIIRLDGREYVPAPLARDERGRAEAAEARAAELEAAQRWRPVGEHLPAHGVKVEGFDEVDGQFIGRFGLRGWRAEHGAMSAYRTFSRVTHWRPLLPDPTAPEVQPVPATAPAPAPPERVWQVVGYTKEPMHGEGRTAREAVMWALDEYGIEEEVMEEATFGPMRFEARPWLDDETLGDAEVVTLEAHASEPVVRWAPAREPQP